MVEWNVDFIKKKNKFLFFWLEEHSLDFRRVKTTSNSPNWKLSGQILIWDKIIFMEKSTLLIFMRQANIYNSNFESHFLKIVLFHFWTVNIIVLEMLLGPLDLIFLTVWKCKEINFDSIHLKVWWLRLRHICWDVRERSRKSLTKHFSSLSGFNFGEITLFSLLSLVKGTEKSKKLEI